MTGSREEEVHENYVSATNCFFFQFVWRIEETKYVWNILSAYLLLTKEVRSIEYLSSFLLLQILCLKGGRFTCKFSWMWIVNSNNNKIADHFWKCKRKELAHMQKKVSSFKWTKLHSHQIRSPVNRYMMGNLSILNFANGGQLSTKMYIVRWTNPENSLNLNTRTAQPNSINTSMPCVCINQKNLVRQVERRKVRINQIKNMYYR